MLWGNPSEPFLLEINIDKSVNAYPKIAFGYPITEIELYLLQNRVTWKERK